MSRQITRTRLATVVVATVAMAALAACGGSSSDSGDAKSESTSLRLFKGNPQNLTQIGADGGVELGYYDKAGLDVDLTISKQVPQSMSAGNADIAMSSVTEAVGAILNGLDATILATIIGDWDRVLIVSPDSKAKSFEDLKGETFGVTTVSSSGGYVTAKLADKYGWKKDDYKMVSLGSLDGLIAALKNNTISAFLWSPQASVPLVAQGQAKNLGNVKTLLDPAPSMVIYASNKAIKERPQVVKTFMETYFNVIKDFQKDQTIAEKLFVDNWGKDAGQTKTVLGGSLQTLSSDGRIDESLFRPAVEATKFTIPNAKSMTVDDFKKMYRYWGDL